MASNDEGGQIKIEELKSPYYPLSGEEEYRRLVLNCPVFDESHVLDPVVHPRLLDGYPRRFGIMEDLI